MKEHQSFSADTLDCEPPFFISCVLTLLFHYLILLFNINIYSDAVVFSWFAWGKKGKKEAFLKNLGLTLLKYKKI